MSILTVMSSVLTVMSSLLTVMSSVLTVMSSVLTVMSSLLTDVLTDQGYSVYQVVSSLLRLRGRTTSMQVS